MADSVAEAFSENNENPKPKPVAVESKIRSNTILVQCPSDKRELFPTGQRKGVAVANKKMGDGGGYRCTACGRDGHPPAKKA